MKLARKNLGLVALLLTIAVLLGVYAPPAARATDTDLRIGTTGTVLARGSNQGNWTVREQTIDFAEHAVAATSDTMKILTIPAGTYVEAVSLYLDEYCTGTVNVGDASNADGWMDQVVISSASGAGYYKTSYAEASSHSTYAAAGGKYYSSAGYIKLEFSLPIAVARYQGKIRVRALCNQLEPQPE